MPDGSSAHVSQEGEGGTITAGRVTGENGDVLPDKPRAHLERLTRAIILCNEATLTEHDGKWQAKGDAMDTALLAFAHKLGLKPEAVRGQSHVISEMPFESERKYAATFYRTGEDAKALVALKGATETALSFCRQARDGDKSVDLDTTQVEAEALRLAGEGYRILAIASGETSDEVPEQAEESHLPPLEFLGLVAFIDPLRPEVIEAVRQCREAGIEVAMITGDHPATASSIARELDLPGADEAAVTGADLDLISDHASSAFDDKVASAHVFARVSPLQKLHIVESLRRRGHFVAVTGDGVNDAPAMRAAHIGVAMGSGTEVAKDVASIIVTDDNFASIVRGVEEGRHAYDNIRKVIYLLISTGAAEILLFMLAVALGAPLPLLPVQILWLNLVTNGIQDVALAFEAGEPGAMKRKPRPPNEGIFNRLMIQQTVLSGAVMGLLAFVVWWFLLQELEDEAQARNLLFLFFVLFQNFHVFNCRSEQQSVFRIPLRNNPLLIAGVAVALGLHLLVMQFAFTQDLLGVAPVTVAQFFILLALASTSLWTMEIFKWFQGRKIEARMTT
jgi:magnesium-transporting ATPase (P-type)